MHRPLPLLLTAALPAGMAAGLNDVFCSDCFAHAVAWAVENAKKGLLQNAVFRPKREICALKKLARTAALTVLANFFLDPIFQNPILQQAFCVCGQVRIGSGGWSPPWPGTPPRSGCR